MDWLLLVTLLARDGTLASCACLLFAAAVLVYIGALIFRSDP